VALRVKKVGSQEVAIFGQTATNFGKPERLWVLKGSILPPNVPIMEETRKKQSKLSQSCAKVPLRGKSCALA